MNVVAKLCLALAAGAALGPAARAADPVGDSAGDLAAVAPPSAPYATIVARNVFALLPPPQPADPNAVVRPPPPKITATGITDIFGQLNVLFKVAALPGQTGGDKSYMLKEGERLDDIEVVKIDQDAAVITFNNHDVQQDIPLVATPGTGGAGGQGGPAATRAGFPPGSPAAAAAAAARRVALPNQPMTFPATPAAAPATGQPMTSAMSGGGANNNSANNTLNSLLSGGSAPTTAMTIQPTSDLTPEQEAILIEAERARLESMDNPTYNPAVLPPTSLTRKIRAAQQAEEAANPP